MAKAERPISKKSSATESPPIPESSPAPTSSTSTDAPDDLTLEHVMEDLLPRLDDDVFKVGTWLEEHFKGRVRLLGDGRPIHPSMFPSYLGVKAWIDPDGRPRLEIQVRRDIGASAGPELVPPNSLVIVAEWAGALLQYGQGAARPFKRWSVQRESYEHYRPPLPESSERDRRQGNFMGWAAAYIALNGLPGRQTAEALWEALSDVSNDKKQWCPARSLGIEMLAPLVQAYKADLEG
jgi:hypothetical protein